MNQVARRFQELRTRRECAVIPYITAGYPNWGVTARLLKALPEAGADLVEVGIPFSDPVADGPVIQKASEAALSKGMNPGLLLDRLKAETPEIPTIAMGYYNPILRFGIDRFVEEAASAGISGLIVPDLPPEEAGELREAASRQNMATIFLVAPTTPKERISTIANATTGFIYLVSVKGVTGSSIGDTDPIARRIEEIHQVTSLPVCVGFGISSPEQAREISRHAQGIIIGSAVIEKLTQGGVKAVTGFVEDVARAVKG